MLRDYQQRAIDQLYQWFSDGGTGNPCLVLPTGSGKSHIVAALCKDALQNWPETRILMLTHVKELISQNAEKMRQHWPGAPMGIYSAGLKKRNLMEPITFAGVQSVRTKAGQIGHVDLIIVDECHLIGTNETNGYRKLIDDLTVINPALRVIGLTATPYRLGHGYITDKPAIFDALIEPVTIEELIYKGHLAPLHSKPTKEKLSTEGLHKRGGEYIEAEMQAAFDTDLHNQAVVDEVISLAGNRKAWIFFCAGVQHAENIAAMLQSRGIEAACVTGKTPPKQRQQIIDSFRAGKIRALTNANVLTTGFDYPDIDLIAMLRATLSPGLYVQMAGRGLRPKSHTDHCLVLDFAGVVQTHGPITNVTPPTKAGSGEGEAPIKLCDNCHEICHASARKCHVCGFEFPVPEPKPMTLHTDDIMGLSASEMAVNSWGWRVHVGRASGKEMIAVDYYGGLSDPIITEYFTILHDGFAGQRAMQNLAAIATSCGASHAIRQNDLQAICDSLNEGSYPASIEYKKDGKYFRVLRRHF
jgi:DNA repair protein RadD